MLFLGKIRKRYLSLPFRGRLFLGILVTMNRWKAGISLSMILLVSSLAFASSRIETLVMNNQTQDLLEAKALPNPPPFFPTVLEPGQSYSVHLDGQPLRVLLIAQKEGSRGGFQVNRDNDGCYELSFSPFKCDYHVEGSTAIVIVTRA